MAINEKLTARIRESISATQKNVEEKKMFSWICFIVNGKMTVCAGDDRLLVRLSPDEYENALEQPGCRPMEMKGKPMKGYVFVNETALNTTRKLNYWVQLALYYNKITKAAPKKKPAEAVKKKT